MEVKVMCDITSGDYVSASKLAHGNTHENNERLFISNCTAEDDGLADIGISPEKAIKFAEELIDMSKQMIHDRDNFRVDIAGLDNGDAEEEDIGTMSIMRHIESDNIEILNYDLHGRASIFLHKDSIDSLIQELHRAKNFGGNK